MGKLDVPHTKAEVVKLLAAGETQTSIAEQFGVDQSLVSKLAAKNEVKKLIEEEQEKLVKVIPDAVQNVKDLVEEMKDIPKENVKRRELSYKASKDTLKAVGLYPTPQYAHSLTNIYNDNRQQNACILSPNVMDMFAKHAETLVINGEDEVEENSQDS